MTRGADPRATLELQEARLRIEALSAEPFSIQAVEPSPCTAACPAGINVKSYVSLIAERRFAEALDVVRQRCPLPGVCGRICHHPCEDACKRSEVDEAIAIRSLKRFVSDLVLEVPPPQPPEAPDRRERVAIIGSGPAGLTAAHDLRMAGYPVTVFESEPEPGGMLRYGIADYRLPPDILEAEIGALTATGIEIETSCRIGTDRQLEELLGEGYAAVLFAVGVQQGRRLRIDGEEGCPEVEDALAFLRRVNSGERSKVDGTVLVIGGGSTAVEAARAALRLGASQVEIVYRRHREQMPADREEIEAATEEGIGFRLLTAPSRILSRNGRLEGLECLEVALGEPDASGRRRPVPIPGSEFVVPANRILAAVGQQARLDFLPGDIAVRMSQRGLLAVDSKSSMTPLRGIFAAGDVVTGPSTVIDAIAAGHDAAASIIGFLERGDPAPADVHGTVSPIEYEIPLPAPAPASRRRPAHAAVIPGNEFAEVECSLSADDAVAEARRCMRCGPCSECLICAPSCGRRHLTLLTEDARPDAPTVVLRAPARIAAGLAEAGGATWPETAPGWLQHPATPDESGLGRAVQLVPSAVTITADRCRGCARCIEVCAFGAISLVETETEEGTARVSATLCRGCNLCTAVCPTGAALSTTVAPGWWGTGIEDLYPSLLDSRTAGASSVILACQRRLPAVAASLELAAASAPHLVPVRCAGQIEAGMLLELYRHGADRLIIAGCLTGSCRYHCGPQLAAEQVARARDVLNYLAVDPGVVIADWNLADEPIALSELLQETPAGIESSTGSEAGEELQ